MLCFTRQMVVILVNRSLGVLATLATEQLNRLVPCLGVWPFDLIVNVQLMFELLHSLLSSVEHAECSWHGQHVVITACCVCACVCVCVGQPT